jgi:hypothetical protein
MNPLQKYNDLQNRRQFLKRSAMGLGATALSSVIANSQAAGPGMAAHFPAKAKRVIFLFMAGASSQIDLFDYKPNLEKQFNKPLPPSISQGQRVTAMTKGKSQLVAPSMFKFSRKGKNGIYMSELLPHLSTVVYDLCIIKSTHTDAINNDPGKTLFCTGSEIPGKASLGSWLSYGLGRMNENLPDFVVMNEIDGISFTGAASGRRPCHAIRVGDASYLPN